MLDTIRKIETPEGVELELRVAGIAPRALAWLIDTSFVVLLIMIVLPVTILLLMAINIDVSKSFIKGLYFILLFVFWWFYDIYFEVRRSGATPGKKIVGLMVVHDDGTPVGWSASFIRNLLRSVDFLPFGHFFGFISSFLNKDFKRLGDLSAGTLVVYTDAFNRIPKPMSVEPLPPPLPLSPAEQRSILDFSERSDTLSNERLAELGEILEGVTKEKKYKSAQSIMGYANWMLGRR